MANIYIGKITALTSFRKLSFSAVIFVLIIIAATALRLYSIENAPPGLNQDAASDAWSANCLLKTGTDQSGAKWPIFSAYGFGGGLGSMLYIWLLLPFQFIGGLNVITTRLPAVFFGVLSVIAVYYVARNLFNKKIGLIAALLLAFNPWSIQQSRWGHQASICAFFAILPLALMLWAHLPVIEYKESRHRPLRAIIAGLLTGISCYGYAALPMFIPALLFLVMLASLPNIIKAVRSDRRVYILVTLFVIAFLVIYTPLVVHYLTPDDFVANRMLTKSGLGESGSLLLKLTGVLKRYAMHFDPQFLFIKGDVFPAHSPPGIGQFHYYMIPLMIFGLISILKGIRKSIPARIALALLLAYPAGDCLAYHQGAHALRSYPGLCGLILIAAVGACQAFQFLSRFNPKAVVAVVSGFVIIAAFLNVTFLYRFFGSYNRDPEIYHLYQSDLVEACNWLKPNLDKYDAVFVTEVGFNQPYVITLVALGFEPDKWFAANPVYKKTSQFDILYSYGKMNFMHGTFHQETIRKLRNNDRQDNVLFIVRPGELYMTDPIHQIERPDGQTALQMYQLKL